MLNDSARSRHRGEVVELLEPRTLLTTAALLADLNTGPTAADLVPGAVVDGVLYAGRIGPNASELWRTDGTTDGTRRLATLDTYGAPSLITPFGDGVAFVSDDAVYVSNGTAGGTVPILTLPASASAPDELSVVGGKLWFRAGGNMYTSDGTAAGTAQVLAQQTTVPTFTAADGDEYLSAASPVAGESALYRTDGTAAGTVAIPTAGGVGSIGVANGTPVFLAGGSPATTLDAVVNGTVTQLATLDDADASSLATVGSACYFQDDGNLWRTDGTAAGTGPVIDLPQIVGASGDVVYDITAAGPDRFYFEFGVSTGLRGATQLYASDGTAAGTTLVQAFNGPILPPVTSARGLAVVGTLSVIYPESNEGDDTPYLSTTATAIWRSDGTAAGTVTVSVPNGADDYQSFALDATDGGLWFDSGYTPTELWHAAASSPTTGSPVVLSGSGLSDSNPIVLGSAGGQTFFTATTPATEAVYDLNAPLWHTDGSAAGTGLVQTADGSDLLLADDAPVAAGGALLFTVRSPNSGVSDPAASDLWRTDGTTAGTYPVFTSYQSDGYAYVTFEDAHLFSDGHGGAYFAATDQFYNSILYHTDGTVAGTVAVTRIPGGAGTGGSEIPEDSDNMAAVAASSGEFYFASQAITGTSSILPTDPALLVTDGTATGTSTIFTPPLGDGYIQNLTPFGNKLFFTTEKGLWTTDGPTDGMAAETVELAPVTPPNQYVRTVVGSTFSTGSDVFFDEPATGTLWETDGTPAGTIELYAAGNDPTTGRPYGINNLTAFAGRAFFTTTDAAHGTELWSSDGTAAGTGLFDDVNPGPASSSPADLTVSGSMMYFTADDGTHGTELWSTDGTAAGTALIADTSPGPSSGDPTGLMAATDGSILFAADDGIHGTELWHTVAGTPVVSDGSPPMVSLVAAVQPVNASPTIELALTYADPLGIDSSTLGSTSAVTLTAPDGTVLSAISALADAGADPTHRTVTYTFAAPGGKLTAADNGTYTVSVAPVVANNAGVAVRAETLGQFTVDVPTTGATLATTVAVAGPAVALGGAKGTAHVTITDAGAAAADGTITVQLLLSTTATADPGTTLAITSVAVPIRLKPGQRTARAIRFTYPSAAADGTDYLIAAVDADGKLPQVDATRATAASNSIAYRVATVDLWATAAAAEGRAGKRASLVLRLHNAGNVTATGTASFALALTGGSLASAIALPAVARAASVKAGATKAVPVPFAIPTTLAAGTYTLTVTLTPTTTPADADAADKSVVTTLMVA